MYTPIPIRFLGAKKAEDATEYARVFSDVGGVFIMHLAQAQQPNAVEYARVGAALLGLPAQEPFSLCEEYFSAFAREVQVSFAAPDSAFIGVLIPAALEAALAHARLPANYEDLSGDEAEEVDRCRAKDSGSVFASLCAIAGPELVFEKLLCALEAVLAGAGGADAARLAEACLFALVTVLHKLDIDETPELPVQRFLAAVSRLPNAQTIRCEAILAYCRCGRWLPDVVVPQALTIIQRELTTAATTTATASATQYHNDDDEEEEEEERPGPQEYAAKGFHELCKTCPTAVAPHAAELLRVFFFNNGTTTTTTSSSSSAIPRKFISQLLKGFREVAACMDDDNDIIVDALKAFCSTAVASIQQQQQQQQQQTMIGLELKRIAQAFKYLRPNSGIRVVPVFTEVLGVLEAIAQTPALLALSGDDVRGSVPKQLCRCCVAAAVAAGGGTAVRPLLPRMLRLGGLMYKARPRACALDMLAALAANAALDVDLGGGAKSLFVETFGFVTQTTLDLMEATKGAAAVNSPDVFKAYYDLAYEAVKALRYAVVADNAGLARVLEMALAILRSVQERSTVEAVTRFLERLFYTAAIDRQCRTVMEAHVQRLGAQLVHTLLCCACGWQPSRYMYAFALVLFSFRKFSANALLLLAASCLEVPLQGAPPLACGKFPFPVDMDARREFLTALESAPQSSDICDALNQFYFVAASS